MPPAPRSLKRFHPGRRALTPALTPGPRPGGRAVTPRLRPAVRSAPPGGAKGWLAFAPHTPLGRDPDTHDQPAAPPNVAARAHRLPGRRRPGRRMRLVL